ncbi:MAG: serine hydrolase domain-containing protein [Longimicrobiales bacterium]
MSQSRRHAVANMMFLVVLVPRVVTGQAALPKPTPAQITTYADSVVKASMAKSGTPGISVAVVRGSDTLLLKGYGQADVENRVPVTTESVFLIGSLTKQFTSAAVMKLVEQGRIRLDATIGDYLSDYAGPGRRVTIHQLLNHTSGIPSYTSLGDKFWPVNSRLDLTHAQMLALFAGDSLQFEPGSKFAYNNSGYYLLGMIIEKVTGQSYAEHVRSALAQPLELGTLRYCEDKSVIMNRVDGYERDGATVVNAAPLSMNAPFAAGSLCSNARDLVRWNSALVAGRVVSAASYTKMTTATTLSGGAVEAYGYGLVPGRLGANASVAHSGGINGFSSHMAYYPDAKLTVVVLTNSDAGDPGIITGAIARYILGVPAPPPAAPVRDLPTTAAERARYIGTFDLAPTIPLQVRVFEQAGMLYGQATGQGPIPLRYQGDNAFEGPDGSGIRMVFVLADGRATQFTLQQGGRSAVAKRIAD